ncbi:MAG: septum formation family protein [Nocardioides sp.]
MRAAPALALLLALTGCSGGDAGDSTATPTPPSSTSAAPPTATAVTPPETGACYRLTFDAALSPTTSVPASNCSRRHTSETYAVGRVDNVVDGHLLTIDSDRVQQRVATACPARLRRHTGGAPDTLRLSMLRAVWFTPSLEESDDGANWYRCDVVGLTGSDELATLDGSLAGVLDTAAGRERWAMCGTAAPDARDFKHVPCVEPHEWRAISVIELPIGRYPGGRRIRDLGADTCQDDAGAIADDPLDYEWGLEGPDRAQWDAGQTYARCWSPDD